jgi:hypothetical protein
VDLGENWEGFDLFVVVGYEVDHLVGMLSEFFRFTHALKL